MFLQKDFLPSLKILRKDWGKSGQLVSGRLSLQEVPVRSLGDHLCTCTGHSGAKKTHDWVVDQLTDFFRSTHKVKTQQVAKSRVHHCGDMELDDCLANVVGPVSLVMDLRIVHDRFGRTSDPTFNGNLHYHSTSFILTGSSGN